MTGQAAYSAARCAPAFFADYAAAVALEVSTAGRGTALRGEPARHGRVGGEGTGLRTEGGVCIFFWGCDSQFFHFFTGFCTPFFCGERSSTA